MKIVSSFTQPHVIPNLYEFLSYAEHKGRYFELLVPIDFHSRERNTMAVNRDHQPFDYQHSSKYLLYKKETNTGLVNYSFKAVSY